MKRITALLMVAALVVSIFPLAAFAKSEAHEGMYGGYYYKASLTSTTDTATTHMSYAGSVKVRSSGTINYIVSSTNKKGSTSLYAPPVVSYAAGSVVLPVGQRITSVSQKYYVQNVLVDSIALNVS